MSSRKHRLASRFTLVEVVIAIMIFAAALATLLSMLGSARTRVIRAQRNWARAHLATSATEFFLLAGENETLPRGVLPEGFQAVCGREDIADLPEEAEEEINGWRMVLYRIIVSDPNGREVAEQTVRKLFAETL